MSEIKEFAILGAGVAFGYIAARAWWKTFNEVPNIQETDTQELMEENHREELTETQELIEENHREELTETQELTEENHREELTEENYKELTETQELTEENHREEISKTEELTEENQKIKLMETNENLVERLVSPTDNLGKRTDSILSNAIDSALSASPQQDNGKVTKTPKMSSPVIIACHQSQRFVEAEEHELKLKSRAVHSNPNFPTISIKGMCRISENDINNCWFTATMQAALSLKSVRTKLLQEKKADFLDITKSHIPECSKLFVSSLDHPDEPFSPSTISPCLVELSHLKPSLDLKKQSNITEFLEALMRWLNKCGIYSTLCIEKITKCRKCRAISSTSENLGPLCLLSTPRQNDTMNLLLRHQFVFFFPVENCKCCRSSVAYDVRYTNSGIIVLHVPRTNTGSRQKVIFSKNLYVPVKEGLKIYHLSVVICCRKVSTHGDHFYTYVVLNDKFLKLNHISDTFDDGSSVVDIENNGFIYFYEETV
ncbi:uncharacterized protein LOC112140090 [Oryzias melastigma]|uniref:uncharacterized protein LOC112140090 n=1 Tax=Oryzias melastigma TaxID=30732 RepID=UPI000CF7BFC7|nr:uncharacterized protein LOC112140090 [Oryzias melastigma]